MRLSSIPNRLRQFQIDRNIQEQVKRVDRQLRSSESRVEPEPAPVLFFNASTRIHRLSLNAAFSLLASWGIRNAEVPIYYVVCQRGMAQCILGTNPDLPDAGPPCFRCMQFSRRLFPNDLVIPLNLDDSINEDLQDELRSLSVPELADWRYLDLDLGQLCLPGLQWALRRYHLSDDPPTRDLFRKYLISAVNIAHQFERILSEYQPQALVVFNGLFYPEAVARAVAQRKGIPVITHEVGLRPFSAFFSHDHATFREVQMEDGVALTAEQDQKLDAYLAQRFKGDFSMAGVQFWPEMKDLPSNIEAKVSEYQRMVTIFANVIFDTSQVHANTVFSNMFEWLDGLVPLIQQQPEVFFVLRAHPDEYRPGKTSRESVEDWAKREGLLQLPNFAFISPDQRVNSYELIRRSYLVLIYNSSIGLEASIMGRPVLSAGRARFTQIPTVYYPETSDQYWTLLEEFLGAEGPIDPPPDFRTNARRFLYHELFHASLDFSGFLEADPTLQGMVQFTPISLDSLRSEPLDVVIRGVLDSSRFVLK